MKKALVTFSVIVLCQACSSFEFYTHEKKTIKKPAKILIGFFESRNLRFDPYISDNFRDVLRFELFKRGFSADLLVLPDEEKKSIDLTNPYTLKPLVPAASPVPDAPAPEVEKNINLVKFHCKKTGSDMLIQGAIFERETGDIVNRKTSSSISFVICNNEGDIIGEAQLLTSRPLDSAMRLKSIASKFADRLVGIFGK